MKKVSNSKNKIVTATVLTGFALFIVVTVFLLVSELTAQAKETDTAPVTTEATFYELPLDLDLFDYIQGLCADYEIPVELVLAVIEVESNYKADAVSKAGAIGLMQVIPEHHEDRMMKLNCLDLFDPYQNVTVGMDYLSKLIDEYDGNFHKALTAYHHGPTGAKDKFFGQGTYQTEYSLKVLNATEKIEEGMTAMFYTDNPAADHDRYQEEQDKQLQKMPKCSHCKKHIQDDHLFDIDGELYCEEHAYELFRKSVDDYVE